MSPLPARPRAWFFDTSTLITMQASPTLNELIKDQMDGEDLVLLEAVIEELELIKDQNRRVSPSAAAALNDLSWLGPAQPVDEYAKLKDIVHWQEQVAEGRVPKHPREHWAEACIIAAIEVLPKSRGGVAFLSEEHAARIYAASHDWCLSMSAHRYLYELVQQGTISGEKALEISNELEAAGRGISCTLEDYTSPTPRGLGRCGQP